MKNSLKIIVLIITAYTINTTNAFAQKYRADDQPPSKAKNLVLEVYINSKNYDEITTTLKAMNGVTLVAYCEETQRILLNYNQFIIPKPEQIVETIVQLNPNYTSKICYNIKFEDIIKNCKLFTPSVFLEVK